MLVVARNATLDGVRGFLALAVMCHHFLICWSYFISGVWEDPPVTAFANMGPAAVSMFFMITSFLFYKKLLDSENISWRKLYFGRMLRLFPMYAFSVTVLLLIVGFKTNFQINNSPEALTMQIVKWFLFTMLGSPDINGFPDTHIIVAGVTWSLRYEWLFYLSLPFLAVFIRMFRDRREIRLGLLTIFAIIIASKTNLTFGGFELHRILSFLLGMIVVELAAIAQLRTFANSRPASLIVVVLVIVVVMLPLKHYGVVQIALVGAVFLLIAAGTDLFGALSASISIALGEASYSIYLVHGIFLFCLFDLMNALSVDLNNHAIWLFLPIGMIFVSAFSVWSYQWIERPFIEFGHRVRSKSVPRKL